MDRLQQLLDKQEISDLLKRWCRAIDRLDLEAIRDVFHPDAVDDHGSYKGGIDGLIAWIRDRHRDIPFSMHAITNCLIDFLNDDRAVAETYCIAMQKYPAEARESLEKLVGKLDVEEGLPLDMTIACRYIDVVTRRQSKWKIERRTVVFDSVSVVPGVRIPDPGASGWVTGKRGGVESERDFLFSQLQETA